MITRIFTAVVYKDGNLYVAECPEVGTASQGATIEEALANLREATLERRNYSCFRAIGVCADQAKR